MTISSTEQKNYAVGGIVLNKNRFFEEGKNRILLIVKIKERKTKCDFISNGKTFTFLCFESGKIFSVFISGKSEKMVQEKFDKLFAKISS